MSAPKVAVPVTCSEEALAVAPGQLASIMALAERQAEVIFQLPTTSPPHAAVLPQVPPESLPQLVTKVNKRIAQQAVNRFFIGPASAENGASTIPPGPSHPSCATGITRRQR